MFTGSPGSRIALLYARFMPASTLHIVDGDSTGGTLKAAGLGGKHSILCWREALYTGPVPEGLSLKQLSRVRSKFWTKGKNTGDLDRRDAALTKHKRYDDVVLWFGAGCVLCQLSLIQLLSWFREQRVSATRLSWVRRHGGELPPEHMEKAYSGRKRVTPEQMQLAERAWQAFRRRSPSQLGRLLGSDLSSLPGMRRALSELLQEYPSRRNGLSRLQTLLMRSIQRQGSLQAAVAVGSVLVRETVGDLLLFDMLRALVRADYPLLEFAEPFDGNFENHQFHGSVLRLTEAGRQVLAGKTDAITLNGIDRWIGGVHLQGRKVRWRWDASKRNVSAS